MPIKTRAEVNAQVNAEVPWITIGTVVDVNDPAQMGRLRVSCPSLGDALEEDDEVTDIPWAQYVSPFGGITTKGGKGPENASSAGPIAYGMWAIPKIGAQAVVMCLDGNPSFRLWLGCTYGMFLPHTLPMGRWMEDKEKGPLSSSEGFIEPMYQNALRHFDGYTNSQEWKTRIAEGQAAGVRSQALSDTLSSVPDERFNELARQGYQRNRQLPTQPHPREDITVVNADAQMYSITTPGLHTILMDDDIKNGKIRIKTTSGNQIILDDTNERIYVSTPDGKNYIEMDRTGAIDIFSERRISVHAENDINFTTEQTFRVSARQIHLRTSEDIRMHADGEMNIRVESDTTLHTSSNLYIKTDINTDLYVGGYLHAETVLENHLKCGTDIRMECGNNMDYFIGNHWHAQAFAGSDDAIAFDTPGGHIRLNSDRSAPERPIDPIQVDEAVAAQPGRFAYLTSRVPIHEPWGRISNRPKTPDPERCPATFPFTDEDNCNNQISWVLNMTLDSSTLELPYTDANANRVDLGEDLGRDANPYWRR